MKRILETKVNTSEEQIQELFEIYQNNEENEFCKIYPNSFFGYTKVVVEQPLIEDGDIKTDKKETPNQTLQNAIVNGFYCLRMLMNIQP